MCFEKNITGFGEDYLISNYSSTIQLTGEFPEIGIYKCARCGIQFFKNGNIFNRIMPGQLDLLKKWITSELKIEKSLSGKLAQIGFSNNWNSEKVAPCMVTSKTGELIDFTVIKVSSNPPLGADYESYKSILFIDQISDIESSKYGLSQEIRKATETAEEMRIGFYPTILISPTNKKIVLNGFELFFDQEGIKGSELKLANEPWDYRVDNYLYSKRNHERTLVIAKG